MESELTSTQIRIAVIAISIVVVVIVAGWWIGFFSNPAAPVPTP